MRSQALPRDLRLRNRRCIDALFSTGGRGACGPVAARAVANGLGVTRLLAVSGKRLGNAVKRNRMRRLLRAAFRTGKDELPHGYDLALIARSGILETPWRELKASVKKAVDKAVAGTKPGRVCQIRRE